MVFQIQATDYVASHRCQGCQHTNFWVSRDFEAWGHPTYQFFLLGFECQQGQNRSETKYYFYLKLKYSVQLL